MLLDVVGVDRMHLHRIKQGEELLLLGASLTSSRAKEEELTLGLEEDLPRFGLTPRDIDTAIPDLILREQALHLIGDVGAVE